MFLRKEGFPEEGELVLCTVTKIHFHSVFVNLDEYSKTGLVHISEVSPGRIRNLRDFVVEGKKIVCKVLRVDQSRGHIDLSLRRVNESQKRLKISEIKQEQLAEKIVEYVAKKMNIAVTNLYRILKEKIFGKYDSLYICFQDVAKGGVTLKSMGIEDNLSKELEEFIKQRIKEGSVEVKGTLSLKTYAPDGLTIIKEALQKAENKAKGVIIRYRSAGNYKITVKSTSYKEGEKILDDSINLAIAHLEKHEGEGSFARQEG